MFVEGHMMTRQKKYVILTYNMFCYATNQKRGIWVFIGWISLLWAIVVCVSI